jgi:hypothetical protein
MQQSWSWISTAGGGFRTAAARLQCVQATAVCAAGLALSYIQIFAQTVEAARRMLLLRALAAHLAAGAAVSKFSCQFSEQQCEARSTNCSSSFS